MSNKWSPPTYADAHPEHDSSKRVSCERCGRFVWDWVLQDMRQLPGLAEDWLCDGCRSHMQRHKIPVDGGESPATQAEWRTRLMEAHGAPEASLKASRAMHGNRPH